MMCALRHQAHRICVYIAQGQFSTVQVQTHRHMSLAGSSTDHLVSQCIIGGRTVECNKSTSLGLLISRHGTPHHLPDGANEKEDNDDDNYEKSDNYDDADNEQNNSHQNKSNKDNDAQRIKRLTYFSKPPCIDCGRHFPQSVWNIINSCEPCDKYWGLKNGADTDGKKPHWHRPPGYQFFHSSQSPSAKAKARANNQYVPPLVSSYEPQNWGVPPPPSATRPALASQFQHRQHEVCPQPGPLHAQHDVNSSQEWTEWLHWPQQDDWEY